jgi:hypothetical protein
MRILAMLVLAVTAGGGPREPFAGTFSAEVVNDSPWVHCELAIAVDAKGVGTQDVSCRSDEGKPLFRRKQGLPPGDITRLRGLLRDAELFQGQFWGSDLRGYDGPLVTLTVHDDSRVAVVVCIKNESFENGRRQALLAWLQDRIGAQWQQRGPK